MMRASRTKTMKTIIGIIALIIIAAAGYGFWMGINVGGTGGTLLAVRAPCDADCQRKWPSYIGADDPWDQIILMRSIEICRYRKFDGVYEQHSWLNELSWAPLDRDAARDAPFDYEVDADFAFGDLHPEFGALPVRPVADCPVIMDTDIPARRVN